jgi:lipopolysaccharide transport protein LptA
LDADAGLIKYQDKRITFIRLTGKPVRFRQKVEGKQQVIDGHADTAEYDISSIRLMGNAYVSTDEVQITNKSIVYDLNEQRLLADNIKSSGDKVSIRIDPKKMDR